MKNVAVRNVRTGAESPADLEKVRNLQARLEAIRLQAGGPIDLGHVVNKTVPRMVAPLRSRGALSTRTSIPNPHASQIPTPPSASLVRSAPPRPASCPARSRRVARRSRPAKVKPASLSSTRQAWSPSRRTSRPVRRGAA